MRVRTGKVTINVAVTVVLSRVGVLNEWVLTTLIGGDPKKRLLDPVRTLLS